MEQGSSGSTEQRAIVIDRGVVPGGLAVAGGLLIALGATLPWITLRAFVFSISVEGTRGSDGKLLAAAGGVLVLLGILQLVRRNRTLATVLTVFALVVSAVAIFELVRIVRAVNVIDGEKSASASLGSGLVVLVLGSLVAAAGGLGGMRWLRRWSPSVLAGVVAITLGIGIGGGLIADFQVKTSSNQSSASDSTDGTMTPDPASTNGQTETQQPNAASPTGSIGDSFSLPGQADGESADVTLLAIESWAGGSEYEKPDPGHVLWTAKVSVLNTGSVSLVDCDSTTQV